MVAGTLGMWYLVVLDSLLTSTLRSPYTILHSVCSLNRVVCASHSSVGTGQLRCIVARIKEEPTPSNDAVSNSVYQRGV